MKATANSHLSYPEQQALKDIIRRIPSQYPMINTIILYGSKSRGDFVEDSDIDILLVTDYAVPRTVKYEIYDMIFEFEVEHSVVISIVFISSDDFQRKDISFLNQAHREGITIWSRE